VKLNRVIFALQQNCWHCFALCIKAVWGTARSSCGWDVKATDWHLVYLGWTTASTHYQSLLVAGRASGQNCFHSPV